MKILYINDFVSLEDNGALDIAKDLSDSARATNEPLSLQYAKTCHSIAITFLQISLCCKNVALRFKKN